MARRANRLRFVLALNLALVVALVGVGIAAHSLGVLSAGAEYLADAAGVALTLLAHRLAQRRPTPRWSFGYGRSSVLAALVNAGVLVAVTLVIAAEAIARLVSGPPPIHGGPVVTVSLVAALAMGAGALALRGDGEIGVRAILLDTVGDALAALGVAGSAVVMTLAHGHYWLDPVVALAIGALVAVHALRLVREAGGLLMEATPPWIDLSTVATTVCEDERILSVHDLHVWGLSSEDALLSAHLVLRESPSLEAAQSVVAGVKGRLAERFGLTHATLEAECEPCAGAHP